MNEKKIEPTEAMVEGVEHARKFLVLDVRTILRTALNHPDAPGLFTDEDDRPWEPLNGPVRVGDEVRREFNGITVTAVVGRVDDDGDPWAAGGGFIGVLEHGTWYVRRAVQELPTEDGAVIVPAEGHEFIEATICGETHYARAALRSWVGDWYAAWRAGERKCGLAASGDITPGTWKVADQ